MKLIDDTGRLLEALRAQGLEFESFFDGIQTTSKRDFLATPLEGRNEVLLVDVPTLAGVPVSDQLLSLLNTHEAVVLFLPSPAQKDWLDWRDQLLRLSDKVVADYELPLATKSVAVLRNQLHLLWRQRVERQRFKEQMVRFSQEMDDLILAAQQEMQKAKRIHEGIVPRRMEDLKGIQLSTKYAVGESGGSEYFDVIRGAGHNFLLFVHTSSYLASSCIMGILNKYKGAVQGLDPQLFLQEVDLELKSINVNKKKQVHVELLLLKIETHSLQCTGHSFGMFELFAQDGGAYELPRLKEFSLARAEEARFALRLAKGEKVIVFSPGFIFNWNETVSPLTRAEFLRQHAEDAPAELLVELFYQLKKDVKSEFLAKDAVAVLMEVQRHAIEQV